jgi:hypothetical protein
MAWAIIASGTAGASTVYRAEVTIDSTGADLIFVNVTWGFATEQPVADETYANTLIPLTAYYAAGFGIWQQLYYIKAPTTGAGHVFSIDQGGTSEIYPSIQVLAVSGAAADPFGASTGATAGDDVSFLQPGSVTPPDGAFLVTGLGFGDNAALPVTINLGFTADTEPFADGVNFGGSLAYLDQPTSTGPLNPQWDVGTPVYFGLAASIAWFVAVGADPPNVVAPTLDFDASDTDRLWTVNTAGVFSVHPVNNEAARYWDDEGLSGYAAMAPSDAESPLWRSGAPLAATDLTLADEADAEARHGRPAPPDGADITIVMLDKDGNPLQETHVPIDAPPGESGDE